MSVTTSLARRALVVLVIVVAAICALGPQHPSAMSSAASAGVSPETPSTAGTPAELTVVAVGTQTTVSAAHCVTACGDTTCGNAHACMEAVTLADNAPVPLARTGVELIAQTGRHPTPGHPVPAESSSPPWTVLSLTQLTVRRV
ncbi:MULTISPECIES: hypothetical protein [unclassified Rhodococcus (in: high G+C Gram-positive bacteria)]|uniref:hypothetical protein n=1 Tax=unclassified Rhodococcus (in: high G+C Gram-positive bacteria) TaxID=192944 RepID=UPI001C9BB7B4|nr:MULTISPECIES: hypothetical protein [unclassified Rhodococcus (in: high G+C Gram-positive bacteria)]MBY6709174.1 hypothetical protein [Rhodococcus sp. BP-241]